MRPSFAGSRSCSTRDGTAARPPTPESPSARTPPGSPNSPKRSMGNWTAPCVRILTACGPSGTSNATSPRFRTTYGPRLPGPRATCSSPQTRRTPRSNGGASTPRSSASTGPPSFLTRSSPTPRRATPTSFSMPSPSTCAKSSSNACSATIRISNASDGSQSCRGRELRASRRPTVRRWGASWRTSSRTR